MIAESALADCARYHEDMPAIVEQALEADGRGWGDLTRRDADELVWRCMHSDPVIWAECMFRNKRALGGGARRFFEPQKKVMRYQGHLVDTSGAGTGKTSRMIAGGMFGAVVDGVDWAYIVHREDAIESFLAEVEAQLAGNQYLKKQFPRITRSPYGIVSRNGAHGYLRVIGDRGASLRGLHISGSTIYCDEVATWKTPAFSELWRAVQAGTWVHLCSVMDGRTDTEFYRKVLQAIPIDQLIAEGRDGDPDVWGLVRIALPDLGPPLWTPAEEARLIAQYGGADTPGYKLNVLAQMAHPVGSIWPRGVVEQTLEDIPGYQVLRATWDTVTRTVESIVQRVAADGTYETLHRAEHPVESFDLTDFALRNWAPEAAPVDYLGVDFGRSVDPTEILAARELSNLELVQRVQIKGCPGPVQAALLAAIHGSAFRPRHGTGLEATGALGLSVEEAFRLRLVQAGRNHLEECSAYNWSLRQNQEDPATGQTQRDAHGNARRQDLKVVATNEISSLVDSAHLSGVWTGPVLRMSPDPEILAQITSHTETPTARGVKYPSVNDHLVEALRALALIRAERAGRIAPPPVRVELASMGQLTQPLSPDYWTARRSLSISSASDYLADDFTGSISGRSYDEPPDLVGPLPRGDFRGSGFPEC